MTGYSNHSADKKQQIISALNASINELQLGLSTHCNLVASLVDEDADENDIRQLMAFCPEHRREIKFKAAIKEAIDVIEESRKAFKSKRLEHLRKKLTQVLIEEN